MYLHICKENKYYTYKKKAEALQLYILHEQKIKDYQSEGHEMQILVCLGCTMVLYILARI